MAHQYCLFHGKLAVFVKMMPEYLNFVIFVLVLTQVKSMPLEDVAELMPDLSYLGNRVFRYPSPKSGKLLENWNKTSEVNPEELGEYAEGDIVFPKLVRNGLITLAARWPNGEIPYEIEGSFDSASLNMINQAINIYHKYTCIKFRKRNEADIDYLRIVSYHTGCWSYIGHIGGHQEVNLQSPGCTIRIGTIIHELMHTVGFLHEHSRSERDDFVSIAWQNIRRGHENNFNKANERKTTGYGVPYDYRSVMHYSSTGFSVNGQKTIIPKDSLELEKMGQREGFSKGDLTKINKMYNCPEKTEQIAGSNSNPGRIYRCGSRYFRLPASPKIYN